MMNPGGRKAGRQASCGMVVYDSLKPLSVFELQVGSDTLQRQLVAVFYVWRVRHPL